MQRLARAQSAILTGSGTVLADDPRLTVRLDDVPHVPPLRVVLDRSLRTTQGTHLLDGSVPTLFLHGASTTPDLRFAAVECAGVAETAGGLDLQAVLGVLAGRGVNELHVEAGPTLCGALFAAGLVDELLLYVAPVLLGDRARPLMALPPLDDMARRWSLNAMDRRMLGEDLRLRLRPRP